jgi:hypothetical protein
MQSFPKIITPDLKNHTDVLLQISRIREEDITDRNTFPSIFMSGRKVGKIPTSSSDVSATDRVGDFNYDGSYLYLLVNSSGAVWRRISLGAW